MFVLMPRKNSGELHEFEFLAIQSGSDLRSPMLLNHRKFSFNEVLFIRCVSGGLTGCQRSDRQLGLIFDFISSTVVSKNPVVRRALVLIVSPRGQSQKSADREGGGKISPSAVSVSIGLSRS